MRARTGDRVWIDGTVDRVVLEDRPPAVALVTRADASVQMTAWVDDLMPDHPALPAVAAWLAEHGTDAEGIISRARMGRAMAATMGGSFDTARCQDDLRALQALVAALAEGER